MNRNWIKAIADKIIKKIQKGNYSFYTFPFVLILLFWFLIRIIPKPSRIYYPCQRTTLVILILYLKGIFPALAATSVHFVRKIKRVKIKKIATLALIFVLVFCGIKLYRPIFWRIVSMAGFFKTNFISLLYAQGFSFSRVVRTYHPHATNWDPVSDPLYYNYVDQSIVNNMVDEGVMALTDSADAQTGWNKVMYNYKAGDSVAIKINGNDFYGDPWSQTTLPQVINGVIKGLKSIGVPENKIIVLETCASRSYWQCYYDKIHSLYPEVLLFDGRSATYGEAGSSGLIDFTEPIIPDMYIDDWQVRCDHLILIPLMRAYAGNMCRFTGAIKVVIGMLDGPPHDGLNTSQDPCIDIWQNPNVQGKLRLIVGDGLFGTADEVGSGPIPKPWNTFPTPFSNSLFFSIDPVAIDSIMNNYVNEERASLGLGDMTSAQLQVAEDAGLGIFEFPPYSEIDYVEIDLSYLDTTLPTVTEVIAITTMVAVGYSEWIDSTTAVNKSYYTLESPIGNEIDLSPGSITISYDKVRKRAIIEGLNLTAGDTVRVTVTSDITDIAGNSISSPDSADTTVSAPGTLLDHFEFSDISNPTSGTPFGITVTAKDIAGDTVTTFTGTVDLSCPARISPTVSGSFTGGQWTGEVTVFDPVNQARIFASSGTITGRSNVFMVNYGGEEYRFPGIAQEPPGECISASTSTVTITFTKEMNSADASDKSNFSLESPIGTSIDLSPPSITIAYVSASSQTIISDLSLTSGDTFKITVSANVRSSYGNEMGPWRSGSGIVEGGGSLDHLDFSVISSPQVVDVGFNVTITAEDSDNQRVTDFTGTVDLTCSLGLGTINPAVSGNFAYGQWMGEVTITSTGTNVTITASTDSITGQSNSFDVVSDTTPPQLVSASAFSDLVRVYYSKDMNYSNVTDKSNYTLESPIGNIIDLSPYTISTDYDSAEYRAIIFGLSLTLGNSFKISVSTTDIRDLADNLISGTTYFIGTVQADTIAPDDITNLSALSGPGIDEATLSWSAPGDDGSIGTIYSGEYRIQYSSYNVIWSTNSCNISFSTSNVNPGDFQSRIVTGLSGDVTWYFRIWTADEVFNWSGISNGATYYIPAVLGVWVSTGTVSGGIVAAGTNFNIASSSIGVRNIGNVFERFILSCSSISTPDNWTVTGSTPTTNNEFRLLGIFNSIQPVSGNYDIYIDTITDTPSPASIIRYSGDQIGDNMPVGEIRWLWISFDPPTSGPPPPSSDLQNITITIDAEQQP